MFSIIIPVKNESLILRKIIELLIDHCNIEEVEVLFVNDGSNDDSEIILKKISKEFPFVRYIFLSRNFGHQNAIKAGLDHAEGECVIMMDGDLQHPVEMIPKLIEKWKEGYDIVYTKRKDSEDVGFIKKITAKGFYKIMNYLSDIDLEQNTADFRLLDRKVVEVAKNIKENDLFWRGLTKWFGFESTCIEYQASERLYGKTKYTFFKMLSFAVKGITSFSIKPLRLAILFGLVLSFLSLVYGSYAVYTYLFNDAVVTGWTSLIISILFTSGIQLLILGIMGEYIGKLFIQSKGRPHYIIKEKNT